MDILRKTGARWRTYSMNIGGWLSQPRKIASEWQSEKEMSMELGEVCEETFSASTLELTCETDKETMKPTPPNCIYCGTEVRDVQQRSDELCRLQDQMQQWKLFQKEQEELRRTAKGIQETLEAELQAERKIKQLLHEQLEDARLSHQDECVRWKSELEEFQRQLEHEVRQRELLQRAYEELKQSLQCSQETLASELQSERNLNWLLQWDLKEAKLS